MGLVKIHFYFNFTFPCGFFYYLELYKTPCQIGVKGQFFEVAWGHMHLDIGGKVICKILKQENNSNPNKWTKNLILDFWTCKEVYQNYFFVHVILTNCYLAFFNGQFNFVGDPLWGVTSSAMCYFVFLVYFSVDIFVELLSLYTPDVIE